MKIGNPRQPRLEALVEELQDRLEWVQSQWKPGNAKAWQDVNVTLAKMEMVIDANRRRRAADRANRSGSPVGPAEPLELGLEA